LGLPALANAVNSDALWEALNHEEGQNLVSDYYGDR